VEAGVDDAVHVEVEIVKLHVVWVDSGGVDWDFYSINVFWKFFYTVSNNFGIPVCEGG
jgi:hypothetical protein